MDDKKRNKSNTEREKSLMENEVNPGTDLRKRDFYTEEEIPGEEDYDLITRQPLRNGSEEDSETENAWENKETEEMDMDSYFWRNE